MRRCVGRNDAVDKRSEAKELLDDVLPEVFECLPILLFRVLGMNERRKSGHPDRSTHLHCHHYDPLLRVVGTYSIHHQSRRSQRESELHGFFSEPSESFCIGFQNGSNPFADRTSSSPSPSSSIRWRSVKATGFAGAAGAADEEEARELEEDVLPASRWATCFLGFGGAVTTYAMFFR